MADHPEKPVSTSPKRFFRAFNSSPFRSEKPQSRTTQKNTPTPELDAEAPSHFSPSFRFHSRSQSHEITHHSRQKSNPTNWTQLIPPLPTSPSPSSRSSSPSGVNVNRHTIANLPGSVVSIPDMLQPSHNLESERSFVLRNELNGENVGNAVSPLGAGENWGQNGKNPFQRAYNSGQNATKRPIQKGNQSVRIPESSPKPASKPGSEPNSSSAFSSAEKLQVFPKTVQNPGNDQGPQIRNENISMGTQRQRSNSKPTKQPQPAFPPQTPPPKLASFTHIQPQNQPQNQPHIQSHIQPQNQPQNQPQSQPQSQPQYTGQYTSREVHTGPNTRKLSVDVPGNTPNLANFHAFGPQPSGPPQLVPQGSSRAVTMVNSQDSGATLHSQLPFQAPVDGKITDSHNHTVQQNQPKALTVTLPPNVSNNSNPSISKGRHPSGKKRKTCNSCHQTINGQFVRALNNAYHIECFKCYECGSLCSAKFFPHEIQTSDNSTQQVPLCEYDYFKKLSLICFTCDSALRGPYITALGNKYHLEHFKCHACGKVFESDESYYEHDNSVYCHFHYSQLFATKCEGCQSSIVKQFVELFKGGKVQQWHPECYMVFKFWNVSVTIDSVGLLEPAPDPACTDLTAKDLVLSEQRIETAVMNCWVVLSGFEETSASCISEMLLSACSGKRQTGLLTTGKFVLYLEVLFRALDFVQGMCLDYKPDTVSVSESKKALLEEVYSVDAFDKFQALRKEPRNISGKLMSYLAILRKSHSIAESGSLSSELLAVITGCAHYLKLLIRIGLNNALTLNKLRTDTKALDGFLQLVKKYEEIDAADKSDEKKSIVSRLSVPHNSTDACRACSKSVEKSCILFGDLRWHHKCFECSKCHRKPSNDFRVESFLCGPNENILCTDCAMSDNASGFGYTSGFVRVSDLAQLLYLLKIALSRSKSAIKKEAATTGSVDYLKPNAMSHIEEEPSETETTYSKTLDEVTSLRQMRESQKLRNSVKKSARKSVILEAPEAATARADNTSNEFDDRRNTSRKGSASSSVSYTTSRRDSDYFEFHTNPIKIRDDPPQRLTSNSLDRTSDLLKNEKSLTLDDIPRIVAAEQAREQRPNAFKHHNSLYQKKNQPIKSVSNNPSPHEPAQTFFDGESSDIKHKYFSELTKQEHTIMRHIAIEALLSISNQFSRDDLLGLIQSKKQNTFWDKFKFGGGDKGKAMNVFGVELKDVAKKYGVDTSLGVGPSQLRIPLLIEDIILALRQKDMSVEGIFRLNGNIKNLRELTEQINASPLKSPNYGNYSAVQLAALMKKWLRELPNPLLTFNLYDLWISSRREENPVRAKRMLQLSYCLLPRSHRNLLEVLLYFFSWVASFAEIDEETGSKMDTHNLATVLAPNILLSKAASGENGENQSSDAHFLAIEVVNQLIEIHEDLALIPNDMWEFYNKCQFGAVKTDSIPTKEISSKIGKLCKENPDFFVGFMRKDSSSEPSHQNTIKSGQTKVHTGQRSER